MSGKNCLLPQVKRLCQILTSANVRAPSSLTRKTQVIHLCRSCSTLLRDHFYAGSHSQFRLKSSITKFLSANMAEGKSGQQLAEPLPPELFQTSVGQQEGWLMVGPYKVFAWSVSGVESCIVIKCEDMTLVFDMGIAVAESVKVPNVFIT